MQGNNAEVELTVNYGGLGLTGGTLTKLNFDSNGRCEYSGLTIGAWEIPAGFTQGTIPGDDWNYYGTYSVKLIFRDLEVTYENGQIYVTVNAIGKWIWIV